MNSKKCSIAKALNELCSSHLIDSDQLKLEAFIEDYFFDESHEEEDPDPPSDEDEYDNYDCYNYPEITAIVGDSIIENDSEDSVITDDLGTTSDIEEHFNGDNLLTEREEEVIYEGTVHDVEEQYKVANFTQSGCGCTLYCGGPCSTAFTPDHLSNIRSQCQELDRSCLDLVLLGQIMATNSQSSLVQRSHQKSATRKKTRMSYYHQGIQICRTTFLFLHGIGKRRLDNVRVSYENDGLISRTHGNCNRRPHNGFTTHELIHCVTYIKNYAETNGILLPGRIPGYKRMDIQLLPTHTTKRSVWREYIEASRSLYIRTAGYHSFCKIWKKFLSHILITKPKSDLCWVCQRNNRTISNTTNLSESMKQQALQQAIAHLERAQIERSHYKLQCTKSREDLKRTFTSPDGNYSPPLIGSPFSPCSLDITVHTSFDFAQQVHYPSNPLQPGPIYFLTSRKCSIFGVCSEGLPRQVNYLIDEAVDTGKGSNTVASLLHDYFSNLGLGEMDQQLHADNCVGQNKNNTVMQYLQWRIMVGLSRSITLSFMVVGHTKFTPDSCFGLVKQRYRRTNIECLSDIVDVVNKSGYINHARLVGTQEGQVLIPTYDWQTYLSPHFKKIQQIKNFHQFKFSSEHPGEVICKVYSDSEEIKLDMRVDPLWEPNISDLPPLVQPRGLSQERQLYLYEKIRPFCTERSMDLTCPIPSYLQESTTSVLAPTTSRTIPSSHPPSPSLLDAPSPPTKRLRQCGNCGRAGHNRRSCKQVEEN